MIHLIARLGEIYDFIYQGLKNQKETRKYLFCIHENGAEFVIDLYNNILFWDTGGFERKGTLELTVTIYQNEIVRSLVGVTGYHKSGTSNCSPAILFDSIISCDDEETLKKLYTVTDEEKRFFN
ncbi:hypothetical protein GK047_18215 [Paenibacillus sp. SYP-B3998]|uniref:Uncharacterized protein n=1 Tax=Paenibacillus sp. SYP-B3998 TaxID=2678564 RepID=A0A6G4A0W6_9BACL|nr:hypothetical protein [Paenibacillus sp. SYP-B3998]NEW07938.1 hypothetical protein [Paenibacillus sp. SYP-B3998]